MYCWPWRNHSVAFKVDRQGINIQTKYLGRGLSSHNTLVVKITRDVCKDDEDLHMSRDTCCFTYCTRSSHNAAVVVTIIVVAAAAAVTCLHININSEVQRRMKISDSWLYYKQKIETIKVGPTHLFGFLQGLIVQLQQCMIPVIATNMMTFVI